MGAGVPRPCSAKRANASTSPGTPARIIIAPMPRVSSRPRNGGRSCQPVIDHGTSPASVHGATTKKTAEPRTAMVRCTAVPDTRCELTPTSPSWFPVVIRVPTRSPCYPKSGNRARLKPECHGGNKAHPALSFCLSMIFFGKPLHTFPDHALVAVRPHLVGNLALLQAVLGQPRIRGLDGARDVIGAARETVRRSHQRAERRH